MAVPKGKVSKERRNTRKSANSKLTAPALVECPQCKELKPAHKACPKCGAYKNETVIVKKEKKTQA